MQALDKKIEVPPGTHLFVNNRVVVVGEKDTAVFTAVQLLAVIANSQAVIETHTRVVGDVKALLSEHIEVLDTIEDRVVREDDDIISPTTEEQL